VRVGVLDGQRLARPATDRPALRADGFTEDPTPAMPAPWAACCWPSAGRRSWTRSSPRAGAGSAAVQLRRLRRLSPRPASPGSPSTGRDDGRSEVAVPVFGTGGSLLAALEATPSDLTSGFEQIRGALLVAAGSLSRQLATTPPPDGAGLDDESTG
jgi:hypothetical protein